MPRARTLALAPWVAFVVAACSNANPESNGSPRACQIDADCGDHAYCTSAHVCRTDCYTDVECYGPGTDVQCTSHGQCIDTTGDTGVGDAPLDDAGDETPSDDAKPSDAKTDAKDAAGEGGP